MNTKETRIPTTGRSVFFRENLRLISGGVRRLFGGRFRRGPSTRTFETFDNRLRNSRRRRGQTPPTCRRPQIVEQRIEPRRRNQRQQQRQRLSADNHDRDRSSFLSTRSRSQSQRQHARDQRERRHQNRPQSIAIALHDRFLAFHSFGAQAVHVIDLQDRVLLHHAEQDQHTERGVEIQRVARAPQRQQCKRHRQRQAQQNRQRVYDALGAVCTAVVVG